jgi:serine/threonine protein kinase/tetratricopeptide (TPR) repeat protein/TolB-like protein
LNSTCASDTLITSGKVHFCPVLAKRLSPMKKATPSGTIITHYRILSRLGVGGMGEVYLAQDTDLDRQVALKMLAADVACDQKRMRRFIQEAKAASSLSHPNVAQIFEIGKANGTSFIVMEYVQGMTLEAKMHKQPLDIREIVDIGIQIADALDEAHTKGITHRDVKPANVMVTPRGRVKVLDFGLAKVASSVGQTHSGDMPTQARTEAGVLMGTVPYMSPEQALGHEVESRSDLFSLGVVFYEMATGHRPFSGANANETIDQILHARPEALARLNYNVTTELERIILKCLEKDPEHRFQSAKELRLDLQRLKGNMDSKPAITEVHEAKPARPNRKRLYLYVVIVGLIVLFIALYLWPTIKPPEIGRPMLVEPLPTEKHLVVLPFANIGGDPANQPFCDGLMEILTSKLSQLEQFQGALRVVPASEVRREVVTSAREARRVYGVTLVITGSVQRTGNAVRWTANLVDANSLRQIRTITSDTGSGDVSVLQDGVIRQVTDLLELELHPEARRTLTAGDTTVPGAYDFYLQGRGYLQRYEREENVDNAIALFHQALERDPKYALAYAGLGEAYWRKYNLTKEPRWVEEARTNCKTALELDRLAQVPVTLGLIYNGTGKYEEAVKEFQRALRLDPVNADAYRELGVAYEALGRLKEAESTYRKAIELRSSYWAGYEDLGAFYWGYGRYNEAEPLFRRMIQLTPDNARGYSNLGGLYHLMGRYDEAAKMLQKSLTIKPTSNAYSNLGTVYYYQGRYIDAARMYERAIQLGASDYQLWGNLGDAYHQTPELANKAPAAYMRAIELAEPQLAVNRKDAPLRASLAVYWAKLGNKEKALAEIAGALRLAPSNVNILFRAALAYELTGLRDRALKALQAAMQGGYSTEEVRKAPHLSELRRDPRYRQMVAGMSSRKSNFRTTQN